MEIDDWNRRFFNARLSCGIIWCWHENLPIGNINATHGTIPDDSRQSFADVSRLSEAELHAELEEFVGITTHFAIVSNIVVE